MIHERPQLKYWVSCKLWTVQVNLAEDERTIVWTAPILRKFIGQPFANLLRWAQPYRVKWWLL